MPPNLYACPTGNACDRSKMTVDMLLEQIELGVLDKWFRLNPPMDNEDHSKMHRELWAAFDGLRGALRRHSKALLGAPVNITVGPESEHPSQGFRGGDAYPFSPVGPRACELTSNCRCAEGRPSTPWVCRPQDQSRDEFQDGGPRVADPANIIGPVSGLRPYCTGHFDCDHWDPSSDCPWAIDRTHEIEGQSSDRAPSIGIVGSCTPVSGSIFEVCDPDEEHKEELKRELRHELKVEMLGEFKAAMIAEIKDEVWTELGAEIRSELGARDESLRSALSQHAMSTQSQVDALAGQVDKMDILVRAEVAEELIPVRLRCEEQLADAIADIDLAGIRQHELYDAAVKAAETRFDEIAAKGKGLERDLIETYTAVDKLRVEMQSDWQRIEKEQKDAQDSFGRLQRDAAKLQETLQMMVAHAENVSNESAARMHSRTDMIAQQVTDMMAQVKQYVQQATIDILQQRSAAVDAIALHSRPQTGSAPPPPPSSWLPIYTSTAASSSPSRTSLAPRGEGSHLSMSSSLERPSVHGFDRTSIGTSFEANSLCGSGPVSLEPSLGRLPSGAKHTPTRATAVATTSHHIENDEE